MDMCDITVGALSKAEGAAGAWPIRTELPHRRAACYPSASGIFSLPSDHADIQSGPSHLLSLISCQTTHGWWWLRLLQPDLNAALNHAGRESDLGYQAICVSLHPLQLPSRHITEHVLLLVAGCLSSAPCSESARLQMVTFGSVSPTSKGSRASLARHHSLTLSLLHHCSPTLKMVPPHIFISTKNTRRKLPSRLSIVCPSSHIHGVWIRSATNK